MAVSIPIVSEFVNTGIKQAERAFLDIRKQVAQAEGTMGKFKAAGKGVFDAVGANAASFAAAAGTALVTFAAKGVTAFQDLALSADKFAGATGLAVEEASRLMEVAGDLGIDTGTLETNIGKMNQNLGKSPDLFEELGVQVEYAKDGTVDANETFLNVIDRLNGIKDPAERARVASQLLGKGWQNMSNLIMMGSEDLRKSLSQVSDAKTISPEEAERARKFRDTMDSLSDSVSDLGLMLGEVLVPILEKAASILTSDDAKQFFDDMGDGLGAIWRFGTDPVGHISDGVKDLASAAKDIPGDLWERNFGSEPQKQVAGLTAEFERFRQQEAMTVDVSERFALMEKKKNEHLEQQQAILAKKDYAEKYVSNQQKMIDQSAKLRTELDNIDEAWNRLTGNLNMTVTFDRAQQELVALEEAAAKAFATGAGSDIAAYNEAAAQFVGTLAAISEGLGKVASREIKIRFNAEGPGAALALAAWYRSGAELSGLNASQLLGAAGLSIPGLATGGVASAGGTYLVGERGPELLTMGARSGYVTPNHALGVGGSINVTVNGADPNEVVRALQAYVRQSGPVPVNTRTM